MSRLLSLWVILKTSIAAPRKRIRGEAKRAWQTVARSHYVPDGHGQTFLLALQYFSTSKLIFLPFHIEDLQAINANITVSCPSKTVTK